MLFVFSLSYQLLVECLCPATVITADDALPCQAVTPSTPAELSSVRDSMTKRRGRGGGGERALSSKGQREELAECL